MGISSKLSLMNHSHFMLDLVRICSKINSYVKNILRA